MWYIMLNEILEFSDMHVVYLFSDRMDCVKWIKKAILYNDFMIYPSWIEKKSNNQISFSRYVVLHMREDMCL